MGTTKTRVRELMKTGVMDEIESGLETEKEMG
jgi:hypothetical protein